MRTIIDLLAYWQATPLPPMRWGCVLKSAVGGAAYVGGFFFNSKKCFFMEKVFVEIIGDIIIYGQNCKGRKDMYIKNTYASKYRKSGVEVELNSEDGAILLCCANDIKKLNWID